MTARAGLTVVGQIVGASVGGALGAAIGGAVGSLVGGALDGPTRNTQALLDDLSALKFDYGSTWPRIYGRYRVKVTPIWSSTKRPIAHDTEVNSKGGPDQINRTFTYEQDWLCWAPLNAVGWARIWINGKLRASRLSDADADTIEASAATPAWADVTFFDGAADQLPWAVYEAAVGTDNACAYRYRPTIAFSSLDLGTGGQPPLIEVEFVQGVVDTDTGLAIRYAHQVAEVDALRGDLQPFGALALGTTSGVSGLFGENVRVYSINSVGALIGINDTARPIALFAGGLGSGTAALMVFGTDDPYACGFSAIGNGVSFDVELPHTENWLGTSELRFATRANLLAVTTSVAIGNGPNDFDFDAFYEGNQGRIYIYDLTGALIDSIEAGIPVESIALADSSCWALYGGNVYPFTGLGGTVVAGDAFAAPSGTDHVLFCSTAGKLHCVNAAAEVYLRDADAWALLCTLGDGTATDLGSTGGTQYGADGTYVYIAKGIEVARETVDNWYYLRPQPGLYPEGFPSYGVALAYFADYYWSSFPWGTPEQPRATKDHLIVDLGSSPPASGYDEAHAYNLSCSVLYGYPWVGDGDYRWINNEATQVDLYIDRLPSSPGELPPKYMHDLYRQRFGDVVTPEAVPLSEIVLAEETLSWSGEAGALASGQIDVSDLTSTLATGFLATGSPRESVAQLMDVFYFGVVCSDKLYHRLRGAASIGTVTADDTGAGVGRAGDIFAGLERGNDLEQAMQVAVTGPNVLTDYEPGTEISDRLVGVSVELRRYTTAVVFSPAERKGRADTMVLDGRVASHTGQVALDDRHVEKEVFDVWIQTDDEGNTYRVRAERETYADGVHTFDVVLDDATVLASVGITTETDKRALTIAPAADTEALLIDAPIVRDADDARGFYALGRAAEAGRWTGYGLFASADGITYASAASSSSAGTWGTCSVVPGAGPGARMFDETSAIVVDVGDGTLASSTRDAVLNDTAVNAFVIGADGRWLFGQFRDAALVSAGVYRLTGLLLGGFGTEQHLGTQLAGDTFALMRYTDGLLRVPTSAVDQDALRYYKPVSVGQAISAAVAQTFTEHELGKKPRSPVDVRASRASGDITFTWQRRSRLQVRAIGAAGILIPLGEESEAYSIDVYADGTFATVLRTLTSSTPSVAYSAAQQTTDFGSPQASVSVAVHQLSSAVGRGFPAEATA